MVALAMAYGRDLRNSALRHFEAAQTLERKHRKHPPQRAVAAYLYGIAAELALKQLMIKFKIPFPKKDRNKGHPYFLHFPDLKRELRNHLRRQGDRALLKWALNDDLMNGWDVSMRYAPSSEILDKPIEKWAEQARELVREMENL
jgi:hypothetical protein